MAEIMESVWMVVAGLIVLMHILSPVLKERAEKLVAYVALLLHIPLFIALLLAKAKIELVAVVITLSFFVYILANTIIPYIKKRKNKGEEDSDK